MFSLLSATICCKGNSLPSSRTFMIFGFFITMTSAFVLILTKGSGGGIYTLTVL